MAKKVKLDLADPVVIYRLCFQFFEYYVDIHEKMCAQKIEPEQAAHLSMDLAEWMSMTLNGYNENFRAKEGWSGAPLGRHLRRHFFFELAKLPSEEQEIFEDDESVMMFVVCQMMSEMRDLILEIESDRSDQHAEQEGRRTHEFLVRWTELFTNERFPSKQNLTKGADSE